MVTDSNSHAAVRMNDYNLAWLPTTYFDGGYRVLVGGYSGTSPYMTRIQQCGQREVAQLGLSVSLEWLGSNSIQIHVVLYNGGAINKPPVKPGAPAGPTSGTIETPYTYTTSTTDPEADMIYYQFTWGDGDTTLWLGPYASGANGQAAHSWDESETYEIKSRAKDTLNHIGPWSTSLWVYFVGYLCGDANGDGSANVSDAVWIINYVFAGGAPPNPLGRGEANCDGAVNVSDAVYIINYVFAGGYAPCYNCPK